MKKTVVEKAKQIKLIATDIDGECGLILKCIMGLMVF